MALIAGPIITQPPFVEPDCHDHFQPIFQHNHLCRASLGVPGRKRKTGLGPHQVRPVSSVLVLLLFESLSHGVHELAVISEGSHVEFIE